MYTLTDIRPVVSKFVDGGVCPDSVEVLTRVNEAIQRLMDQGNWKNLVRRMRFVTRKNAISLPYFVEKILTANIDTRPINVFGQMYEFLLNGPGSLCNEDFAYNDLEDLGEFPTFFSLPDGNTGRLIAFSDVSSDINSYITIKGRDSNNNEISEAIKINAWIGGLEGSIKDLSDRNVSWNIFSDIDVVNKPETLGQVSLFSVNIATYAMWFLAKYNSYDKTPSFRRYRILGASMPNSYSDTSTSYGHTVDCLVKLRYVPARSDTDVLLIQNLTAIKQMVMAIKSENSGDFQTAQQMEIMAIRTLEKQLSNYNTNNNYIQINSDSTIGVGVNLI